MAGPPDKSGLGDLFATAEGQQYLMQILRELGPEKALQLGQQLGIDIRPLIGSGAFMPPPGMPGQPPGPVGMPPSGGPPGMVAPFPGPPPGMDKAFPGQPPPPPSMDRAFPPVGMPPPGGPPPGMTPFRK